MTVYPAWESDLKPAPGDLRIVQAFVNTSHVGKQDDEIASPASLLLWLAGWNLVSGDTKLGPRDQERAVEVRKGLRALIGVNVGADLNPEVLEALDEAAATAKLAVRFATRGETCFEPAESGIDAAIARLLLAVAVARHDGNWQRMKVCREPECRRVYYDFSPGRTSRWCIERCGNRRSARRLRKRREKHGSNGRSWLDDWTP